MNKPSLSIDQDIEQARREGVVFDQNLPFLLEPLNPNGAGVVLVHGFTASPWEMRRFGEELAGLGYLVLGTRLPGHGTTPEDLERRRFEEWQETVTEDCRKLMLATRRIYGIGVSTGALLLLGASDELPLSGVVLLSPYLRVQHRLAAHTGLLRFFKRFQHRSLDSRNSRYYYDRRPVRSIHQIQRLIKRTRKLLPELTTPALVVSAEGDRTIRVSTAVELYEKLGSEHKEYHRYGPDVPHVLTTPENPSWREVLELTVEFIGELETRAQDDGSAQ
ncbi:MAG: alpha/beta fold hydrolase [Desulfuromonadales bacterium]